MRGCPSPSTPVSAERTDAAAAIPAAAIATDNATTAAIVFPFTVAWDGVEKADPEEGERHERKQILGQRRGAPAGGREIGGAQALAATLTAADRCDRCGARAYVRVLLPNLLELLFCAHHNGQYASALTRIAVEIHDETGQLARAAA